MLSSQMTQKNDIELTESILFMLRVFTCVKILHYTTQKYPNDKDVYHFLKIKMNSIIPTSFY